MGSASSTNSHRGQRDSWRHYIAAGRLGTTDILKQTTMQQDNFSTENEDSDYSLYYCLVFQRVPAASVLDGSRTEWMWIRSTTWGRGEHWQLPVSTASWWSRNTNTEKNKPSLGSTNGKKKKSFVTVMMVLEIEFDIYILKILYPKGAWCCSWWVSCLFTLQII